MHEERLTFTKKGNDVYKRKECKENMELRLEILCYCWYTPQDTLKLKQRISKKFKFSKIIL